MEVPSWDTIVAALKTQICARAATDVRAAAEAAEIVMRIEKELGLQSAASAESRQASESSPWGGDCDPFAEQTR